MRERNEGAAHRHYPRGVYSCCLDYLHPQPRANLACEEALVRSLGRVQEAIGAVSAEHDPAGRCDCDLCEDAELLHGLLQMFQASIEGMLEDLEPEEGPAADEPILR